MKLPSFPIFSGQNKPKEEDFNPFPDLSPTPPPKKLPNLEFIKGKTEYIIFSISLLILLGTLSFYLSSNKNNLLGPDLSSIESSQQIQATPTPTPKPLPTGKQIYNYSHGSTVVGPKPTEVIIDPINPEDNQEQTLTITVPHSKEIIKTKATLITDNKSTNIILKKDKGSENIYIASWKMTDTYNYDYQITFEFSDESETFTGALTLRQ